ncbi:MAG: helix-turn-helix transcriptional regulator [Lentisphaeria bacterium]|nr:helix-turn-helix transcriptional regulator [Lentisphaeria bacterium]
MKFHYETVLHAPGESFSIEAQSGPVLDCVYHVHPEFELTLVESGFGTRFVGDLIEPFRAWDLILVGGMVPHHYLTRREDSTGPEWSRTRVVKFDAGFRGGAFSALPEFEPLGRMLEEAASAGLHFPEESARRIAPELRSLPGLAGWKRFLALAALLCRLAEEPRRKLTQSLSPAAASPDERLNRVLRFIHRRLEQKRSVTLEEAAAQACLTPPAFSHYFRTATRKRFVEYVTQLKLSRAAQLLANTDRPVMEIALDSGFSNLSNFNRHFLRYRNSTPRDYRRLFR